MNTERYRELRRAVANAGYVDEILWASSIAPCADATDFAIEHAFVVCNSGMKAQIARAIFERVKVSLLSGRSALDVFGHKAKAAAIDAVYRDRARLYEEYLAAPDRVEYLASLPWIGGITKYHLAKNLGHDCCKPDRHLERIAARIDTTPADMCARLAAATGDRVAVVDTVLWRAANLGLIRTNEVAHA
jgi:hypothetical protein